MGTRNDWKNIEMTMYWRIKQTETGDVEKAMAFGVRGGPHHSSGFFGDKCSGTAYYVALIFTLAVERLDGCPSLGKELGHNNYASGIFSEDIVIDIKDRWIGMKGIFYTKANGNPFIELWLDNNADNNWERILYTEDDGNWFLAPSVDNDCGGEQNERITWGGPGVIFKLACLTRVDMKCASVREIMPPEGWPLRYLLERCLVSRQHA
jgi:hypothetical protein